MKELLVKCWMTHDGMWFLNAYLILGMKQANRLNKAAIKSLAKIESARVRKALGKENEIVDSFDKVKDFIDNGFSVLKGDFMNFEYSFLEKNVMHWEMRRCFAYEGINKLGKIDEYECGVLYRVMCWLDSLKVKHTMKPRVKGCLKASGGECVGDCIFEFD